MNPPLAPVDLKKASRLIHHGPTVLVSAHHGGVDNVMAVGWACALDFDPPKLTVVLDKMTRTRQLVEQSGLFASNALNQLRQIHRRHMHIHPAGLKLGEIKQIVEQDQ